MRTFVTGGAGFIGGHLAETFAENGHSVTVLDDLDPYYDVGIKERNLERIRAATEQSGGDLEVLRDDIRDYEAVSKAVAESEFVFHQAAQAGVRTSVENPRKPNSINVEGTLNVLDAARDSETERVVLASSSSVYGKPEYLPYDEAHPTTPVSPYGVSKLAAEQYGRVYNEIYGLPTVSALFHCLRSAYAPEHGDIELRLALCERRAAGDLRRRLPDTGLHICRRRGRGESDLARL